METSYAAFGTEMSWLLPAALIALAGGLWLTRRAPRIDRTRAGLVLWAVIVAGLVEALRPAGRPRRHSNRAVAAVS
jgi:hypothetical protein